MDAKLMAEMENKQAVELRIRDLLLKALTFSSGAIDAISFLALGKVFTAFMTGNIAFLGLRLAGAGGPEYVAILASIVSFSVGIFLGTAIVKPSRAGSEGVWPSRVTRALCFSLLGHAGFLVLWFAFRGQPSDAIQPVLLGLWAFAMGLQSAAVRSLQIDGVLTTAATGTVMSVIGDLVDWSDAMQERTRLWGILTFLFLGALAGGLLLAQAPIYAPVPSFVITSLVVLSAAIAFRNRTAVESNPANRPSIPGLA